MDASVSPVVMNNVPKARKSFKGSAPKKFPKMTNDEDARGTASQEMSDSILDFTGVADEVDGNRGLHRVETMQSECAEENSNDEGAVTLEDSQETDDYEDDMDAVFGNVLDTPVEDDDDDDENFPSADVRELFQKMPLQIQPHRIRKNLKTMQYECPYCSFASLYYSAVSNHTLIHTGEKPYQCHLCNYRARQRGHIIIHMRIHSGKKPFKCTQCSYSTIQRNHLRIHMQVHSKDRPFQCPGCTYRSKHLSVLQMHIKKYQHNRTFKCDKCDYKTARKHNLIQHMSIHTGAKPFKCDLCPYESSQKGHLNVHIRIHTREKPYKCHECPFASTVPKSLREHMGMHQGQRPYQCPHCTFSTIQSFSLKKHIALHVTENKMFQCDHCSYSSSVEEDFLKHCAIHSASSEYLCSSCDFTTPFKYQYTKHMMSHIHRKDTTDSASSDVSNDSNFHIEDHNGKEKSGTCEMTVVRGKLGKKSGIKLGNSRTYYQELSRNWKNGSKLRINVDSLVNKGIRTPEKQQNQQSQVARSETQTSLSSVLPTPWDSSCSPKVKSFLVQSPKKKTKKAFICLYCDTKILDQEDWIQHEMRHFNTWPEIV